MLSEDFHNVKELRLRACLTRCFEIEVIPRAILETICNAHE